jgi:hypothetical protein
MSKYCQFDAKDDALLGAAVMFLKKVAIAETTTPAQLASVAKTPTCLFCDSARHFRRGCLGLGSLPPVPFRRDCNPSLV